MSFEHPLALLLLVVPAILLWLRTRAERPRPAEASSLLVWQKVSPSDTVPEKPRPPLAAWIEAAGAALLALGIAGPFLPGANSVDPVVLLDGSPSMQALRPNGKTRNAEVESAGPADVRAGHKDLWRSEHSRMPAYSGIAEFLDEGKRVVVVTDHRLPGTPDDRSGVVVVGVGDPCFNAGITAASGEILPDGHWRVLLVVEAFGAMGPVEGTLTLGEETSRVTLQTGSPLELARDLVPPKDRMLVARVAFPGDALPGDDEAAIRMQGGHEVEVRSSNKERNHPLIRAAIAAGATWTLGFGKGEMHLISMAREVSIVEPPEMGEVPVDGRSVVAMDHPLAKDVRVDPAGRMGMRGSGSGSSPLKGVPVLADDKGPLVTLEEIENIQANFPPSILRWTFVPGGTWVERDPSFVVFAKNLVEYAGGGPARIEAKGVLDAKETREAAEGETFGDLKAAVEESRRPDLASRVSYAFVLLMLGGGGLAAAWLAMR